MSDEVMAVARKTKNNNQQSTITRTILIGLTMMADWDGMVYCLFDAGMDGLEVELIWERSRQSNGGKEQMHVVRASDGDGNSGNTTIPIVDGSENDDGLGRVD